MMMQKTVIQGWIMLLAIVSITSNVAMASTTTFKTTKAGPAPALYPEITSAQFDKAMDAAKARGKRTVAAADKITDQALSASFINLRSRVIGGAGTDASGTATTFPGVKTADDLQAILKDINDDTFYAKLSADAQFAAAQMAPLIAFRGFFNRTIEWIKPTPIAHMGTVAALRALGSGVTVYFPTAQWKAGIQYLTVPSDDMGPIIRNEDDMHAFLEKDLIPAIVKMKDRLDALNFGSKPVYFDNQIFYGTANFFSDRDRYVRVGEAERRAVLANAFYSLSGLESLNAYNLNGLLAAADQISKNYGYNSFLSFNPDATTAKKRFQVFRDTNSSTGFLNLRDGGKAWMLASYNSLTGAVVNNALSFHELKQHLDDTESYGNLMDPRSFIGGSRMIASGLTNLRYIVTGQGTTAKVQSGVVSTEGRIVSLQGFFANPPTSIVNLMPTGFDESAYNMTAEVTIDGKKTSRTYHNFLSGRPTAWPLAEYQKVFPEVQSSDDIPDTARVMSQSWGGWLLGVPMSALVL